MTKQPSYRDLVVIDKEGYAAFESGVLGKDQCPYTDEVRLFVWTAGIRRAMIESNLRHGIKTLPRETANSIAMGQQGNFIPTRF